MHPSLELRSWCEWSQVAWHQEQATPLNIWNIDTFPGLFSQYNVEINLIINIITTQLHTWLQYNKILFCWVRETFYISNIILKSFEIAAMSYTK